MADQSPPTENPVTEPQAAGSAEPSLEGCDIGPADEVERQRGQRERLPG